MNFNEDRIEFLPLDDGTFKFVQGFSCGDHMIDGYLKQKNNALNDHKLGVSSTTIVVYDKEIVAFFTANCAHLEIPVEEAIPFYQSIYFKLTGKEDNGLYLMKFLVPTYNFLEEEY